MSAHPFLIGQRSRFLLCAVALSLSASAPAAHAGLFFKRFIATAAIVGGTALVAKSIGARNANSNINPDANAVTGASPSKGASFVLEGLVIAVEDGDTIKLLTTDHQQKNIRLTDIDAPESRHGATRPSQPFSRASKDSMSQLVFGKTVRADCYDTDQYSRPVCRVFADGVDVNLEQIRRGMAWANLADKRYVRDSQAYALHEKAKSQKIGLWADAQPIEPWSWRKVCWKQGVCNGAGS